MLTICRLLAALNDWRSFCVVGQRRERFGSRSLAVLMNPFWVWKVRRRGTEKARLAPAEKPDRAVRVVSRPRSAACADR